MYGTKFLEILAEEYSFNGTYGGRNNAFHTTADDSLHSTTLSENVLCQCWTKAYFKMALPVAPGRVCPMAQVCWNSELTIEQATLPLSYQIQGPTSYFVAAAKKPHTIHQLPLVLSYLFNSAMLPGNERTLWRIHRRGNDWEKGFVLQYDGPLSWFIAAREALTRSEALYNISMEDYNSRSGTSYSF